MVNPKNCLDFLKQTTQFLGYSIQVLPASIIGITITFICLALPLPHMQSFSSFQLFPCYTIEILLKHFIPSSRSSCQNLSVRRSAREQQQYYLLFAIYLKMLSVTLTSCI